MVGTKYGKGYDGGGLERYMDGAYFLRLNLLPSGSGSY